MPLDFHNFIIGIDEAGRGPIAGPVSVGIVRAAEDFDFLAVFPGLNDSKKLNEKNRECIFDELEKQATLGTISYRVLMPTAQEIDERGIAVVIREAIIQGLGDMVSEGEVGKVWLDGALRAPDIYIQATVIGGDALIPPIMLASVAAKVTRDRHMVEQAKLHPLYGFENHKGYGTVAHYAALKQHGQCILHRKTFIH